MDKTDAYAITMLAIPVVLLVGFIVCFFMGIIDTFVLAVCGAAMIIILVFLITVFGVGTHAFFKKKDTVHYNSSMTLDDVVEVDREMEKK